MFSWRGALHPALAALQGGMEPRSAESASEGLRHQIRVVMPDSSAHDLSERQRHGCSLLLRPVAHDTSSRHRTAARIPAVHNLGSCSLTARSFRPFPGRQRRRAKSFCSGRRNDAGHVCTRLSWLRCVVRPSLVGTTIVYMHVRTRCEHTF